MFQWKEKHAPATLTLKMVKVNVASLPAGNLLVMPNELLDGNLLLLPDEGGSNILLDVTTLLNLNQKLPPEIDLKTLQEA